MDTTTFRALALMDMFGGGSGGGGTVVVQGEITCTDDGEGNITITQESDGNG